MKNKDTDKSHNNTQKEEWNEKIDDVIYPAKTSVDYHLPSRHGRFLSKMLKDYYAWSWSWLKDDYAQVLVLVERLLCSSLGQTHHGGTNAYLLLKESAHTKFCFSNPGLRQ